jgi:hypothetical protein
MGQPDSKDDDNQPSGDAGKQSPDRAVGAPISATPADGCNINTPPPRHAVRLVQHQRLSFSAIDKAESDGTTHEFKKNKWTASKGAIIEQMRLVESGDIFTSDTHVFFPKEDRTSTSPRALGITRDEDDPDDFVYLAEMVLALKQGTPPSAVVICGCCSAQLLAPIISQAGVSVAIGIGGADCGIPPTIAAANCSAVASSVTVALMMGKTIAQAVAAGNAALNSSLQDNPVEVVAECASSVNVDLSMKDNKLLPLFP